MKHTSNQIKFKSNLFEACTNHKDKYNLNFKFEFQGNIQRGRAVLMLLINVCNTTRDDADYLPWAKSRRVIAKASYFAL